MFNKLLKNKRTWIVAATIVVLAAGIAVGILVNRNSKNPGSKDKPNVNLETDAGKEEEKPYDGEGLKIVEDEEETAGMQEDSVTAPESWSGTSETDQTESSNPSKGDKNKNGNETEKADKEEDGDISKDASFEEDREYGRIF